MKLKINRNFEYQLLLCSVILNTHIFGFVSKSSILTIIHFIIIIMLNYVTILKYKNVKGTKYLLFYLQYVLIGIIGVQYIAECIFRHRSLGEFISSCTSYTYLLLLIPTYLFIVRYGEKPLIIGIMKIAFLCMIMCCIAWLMFSFNVGKNIFNYYALLVTKRNGRIRIADFMNLWPVLIAGIYIYIYNDFEISIYKKLFITFVLFFTLIFVTQTRVLIIVCSVIWISYQILKYGSKSKKRFIGWLFLLLFTFLMWQIGVIGRIFESFSLSGSKATSTMMRFLESSYAVEKFKDNWICGYGITQDLVYGEITLKYSGHEFVESYSNLDIGIIGSLAMYGIPFVGMYFIPMIRYGICVFEMIKSKTRINDTYGIYFVIYLYLILTSFTLLITDKPRIYMWTITMAIMEYIRNKWKSDK